MSYFLLTSRNTLPEIFQADIPVTNKQQIAAKLVVESFLTESNYLQALGDVNTVPAVGRVRFVEGYTVISITCLASEEDATALKNILTGIRDQNAAQLNRTWEHPVDPNQYTITEATEEEWQTLVNDAAANPVTLGDLVFNQA